MADIQLNFINNSNDTNNSSIVIFQPNAEAVQACLVPLAVINDSVPGATHPVTLPENIFSTPGNDLGSIDIIVTLQTEEVVYNQEEVIVRDYPIAEATHLFLTGIISADIVMTGGGSGETSTPYTFTLQNVVRA